ncbi:glycoside hydrolase family 130 protein [Agromyces binzhouensis]|uniref:Glycosylase n=1 Tax=Agromyces binzhouensis TaxID=1817495 RepID=A0A4Q2JI31_9MICO|nr:glycoside hydrolase family 130 protein [Agromyces binzhouensis]RXZ46149.1 glycosylase [Agromyces binzhouensis]
MTPRLADLGAELVLDATRVILRLFLPGEGLTPTRSRAADVVARITALSRAEIRAASDELVAAFGDRHDDLDEQLARHAETVAFRTPTDLRPEPALEVVLGAAFTAEYAVEAAALCNPSAMVHPDQSGLDEHQLRLAIALRCIGEGHVSSVGFASAVIGPGRRWEFEPRASPMATPAIGDGTWTREGLREALESEHRLNELSGAVIRALPDEFRTSELETAIGAVPADLTRRREAHGDLDTIRTMAWSAYSASFAPETRLSQRVLMPVSDEESNGIEDARFVSFTDADGTEEYRATYTAYDGRSIAPRLLVSRDLRSYSMHRLLGPAATNKGMGLFPRTIDGIHWALTRTDGENISIATSADGRSWESAGVVRRPRHLWETVQLGNCGSPIETDRGWLVITHGVGPMRRYSIGAILLDLDDPRRVLADLASPLLRPDGDLQDGYVPNVVYSCGGIVHDGTLWLPYGVGDQRVRAAAIDLDELLDALEPTGGRSA